MNPLPPLFPVETRQDNPEVLLKKLREKIQAKFKESAKETRQDGVSAGAVQKENCYYIPHNYRLIFSFSKRNFHPTSLYKPEELLKKPRCGSILGFIEESKAINHNSTHFFRFENGSITVKKKTVEVCTYINHKKVFLIPFSTEADKTIKKITELKDNECKKLLKAFIIKFGGHSDFTILKRSSEDKVFGDEAIDSIDIKARFRNEVGKKVYNEHNFEFAGVEYASNYIKSRAIEKIAPELAGELRKLQMMNNSTVSMMRSIVQLNQQTAELLHEIAKRELKKTEPVNQATLIEYVG